MICNHLKYVTVHAERWDKSAKIYFRDFCGSSTNRALPVPIKNLVWLARSVSELWLLLYTVYKNTRPIKRQFLYVHYALRNVSVYALRYTLSVDTAQRSARTAVFREEGLGKTKKEAQRSKSVSYSSCSKD